MSAYSKQTAKIIRACVYCDVKESDNNITLVRCSRCYDEKLVDTLYCSTMCQKSDWKIKHKQFHKEAIERQEKFKQDCSNSGYNIDTQLISR